MEVLLDQLVSMLLARKKRGLSECQEEAPTAGVLAFLQDLGWWLEIISVQCERQLQVLQDAPHRPQCACPQLQSYHILLVALEELRGIVSRTASFPGNDWELVRTLAAFTQRVEWEPVLWSMQDVEHAAVALKRTIEDLPAQHRRKTSAALVDLHVNMMQVRGVSGCNQSLAVVLAACDLDPRVQRWTLHRWLRHLVALSASPQMLRLGSAILLMVTRRIPFDNGAVCR